MRQENWKNLETAYYVREDEFIFTEELFEENILIIHLANILKSMISMCHFNFKNRLINTQKSLFSQLYYSSL